MKYDKLDIYNIERKLIIMQIITLGIKCYDSNILTYNDIESLKEYLKKGIEAILLIGTNNISTNPFTRDIVIIKKEELYKELKYINKKVLIVFLEDN